jgi:hypothetical protein
VPTILNWGNLGGRPRDRVLRSVASCLSESWLARAYGCAVGDLCIALCFHRVRMHRRPTDPLPSLTIEPAKVDALLRMMLPHHQRQRRSRLTISFDDGYADAIDYVEKKAPALPSVEWLVFVCPEKIARRVGFRWDGWELRRQRDPGVPTLRNALSAGGTAREENNNGWLQGLADQPAWQMISQDQLQRLATSGHVRIGNHSNSHLPAATLAREDLVADVQSADDMLAATVGAVEHFAFPFGYPGRHFGKPEVEALRTAFGDRPMILWSTETRPYRADERDAGAVLPRFVPDGTWSAKALVLWLTVQICRFRLWPRPQV